VIPEKGRKMVVVVLWNLLSVYRNVVAGTLCFGFDAPRVGDICVRVKTSLGACASLFIVLW